MKRLLCWLVFPICLTWANVSYAQAKAPSSIEFIPGEYWYCGNDQDPITCENNSNFDAGSRLIFNEDRTGTAVGGNKFVSPLTWKRDDRFIIIRYKKKHPFADGTRETALITGPGALYITGGFWFIRPTKDAAE